MLSQTEPGWLLTFSDRAAKYAFIWSVYISKRDTLQDSMQGATAIANMLKLSPRDADGALRAHVDVVAVPVFAPTKYRTGDRFITMSAAHRASREMTPRVP